MHETGLVAGAEINQKVENHFQGGDAGEGELLQTAYPLAAPGSGGSPVDVKLLPITPSMFLDEAALAFPSTPDQIQAPTPKLASTPNTPAWCTNWAEVYP